MSAKATTPVDAVTRAIRSPLPINDLPLKVVDVDLQGAGQRQGARADRRRSRTARRPAARLHRRHGDREQAGPRRGAAGRVEEADREGRRSGHRGVLRHDGRRSRPVPGRSCRWPTAKAASAACRARVTAFQMDGPGVSMGDLLLGGVRGRRQGGDWNRRSNPPISGPMAALMEAYSPIAASVAGSRRRSRSCRTKTARRWRPCRCASAAGPSPEIASLSAQFNTAALPPGRYLARGTLRQGGKPQGHMIRPFRIVADAPTAAGGAPAMAGAMPSEMAMVMLGGLANFDRKELLTPAMLTSMFAMADGAPRGSKAALKEARGGDLGSRRDDRARRRRPGARDVPERPRAAIRRRNSIARRCSSRTRCRWRRPSRRRGCSSARRSPKAIATRKRPGSASRARSATTARRTPRSRASPAKSGSRPASRRWRSRRWSSRCSSRTPIRDAKKAAGHRVRARRPRRRSGRRAVVVPRRESDGHRGAARRDLRHLHAAPQRPQAATLAGRSRELAKWSKAYAATKGPMQPLVDAWVKHVQSLK